MNFAFVLAEKIAGLSIIILIGFLFVRLRVMRLEDSGPLNQFALLVLVPCAMLNAFQFEFSREKLAGMGICLLAILLIMLLFGVLTALLRKPLRLSIVDQMNLIYMNAGNFLLPIVAAAMGEEWVIYLSPCILVTNLLMFTHAKALLSGENRFHLSMVTKNPVLIATILGFVMFLMHLRLPGIIGQTVSVVGSMMGPIYMFTIGMILGSADLKAVFLNRRVWIVTVGRLLIYPAAAILVFRLSGIFHLYPEAKEVLTVVALTAGAPAGVMITQFTQMYRSKEEAQYSSAITIMSTILCLFTMPLIAALYAAS